jgi:hypothetical protein
LKRPPAAKADTYPQKRRGEHGAAAATKNQPEGADKFGEQSNVQRHWTSPILRKIAAALPGGYWTLV